MASYSQQDGYNSQDDSGEDLFGDLQDTVATLPLSTPLRGADSLIQSSPTQYSNFVTQPTQPLTSPLYQRQRSSSPAVIQVRASSPLQLPTPKPTASNGPRPAPIAKGAFNHGFASSIAPPGTTFRSPLQQAMSQFSQEQQRPRSVTAGFSDDEDYERIRNSSDDELGRVAADIRPSTLRRNGQPIVGPVSSANGAFPGFKRFVYSDVPTVQKRSADTMANAYANSRVQRPAKAPRQDGPVKSRPVEVEMTLDDVKDYFVLEKIKDMLNIVPTAGVFRCHEALMKKRGEMADALDYITAEDDKQTRQRESQENAIDLTRDNETIGIAAPARSFKPPGWKSKASKPPVKREALNSKTIAQKWSSTQAARPNMQTSPIAEAPQPRTAIMVSSPIKAETPPKPRKRLVQGRRAPSSPVVITSDPEPVPVPAQKHAPAQRRKVVGFEDEDEGVEINDDDDDSDVEIVAESNLDLEDRLLNFLNTCSATDLIDVSNQPVETIDLVLSRRPFTSLAAVRAIYIESPTTGKTGRARIAKRQVGDRLVDVCLEMYTGYEAVDQLVAKCEELGKPIAKELKQWGVNAFGSSEGELQIVDLPDSSISHDSGIGTPSSSSGDIEDTKARLTTKTKLALQQPAIMSHKLVMKDYQVTGLNWLALLFSKKLSCILADDMGLGKTCQVIAFLSHLFEIGVKGPHLVVVPGSTLENWLREFRSFCPALRVEPYYGAKNERPEMQVRIEQELAEINVIVTTYTMAATPHDARFLRHLKPVVCVYDEGHALKNSESQRYKELMRIPAEFRLLLTGTPLQNNLRELISLLAFIMPSIFRDQQEDLQYIFKHKAKTTDDDHSNLLSAQRISRARSMMTPFILRRKKHQVLKHLPAKHCRVQYCEMTTSQQAVYDEELAKIKAAVQEREAALREAAAKGKKSNTINIKTRGNGLMDLRKAAIHPLLFRRRFTDTVIRKMAKACLKEEEFQNSDLQFVYEDMAVMTDFELDRFCDKYPSTMSSFAMREEDTPWLDSGKVTALLALLRSYISNGDRTLIFSQFTMVMDILELVLEHANMTYSRLDGNTKMEERQELIDQFYDDPSISIFMLSTKAGGAGINLACANKVVIFDGSFNPQDDVQAENRAHRVGQTREVEVVRLVCRDTVEEAIYKLGETKLVLDERVAGEGAGGEDKKAAEAVEKEGIALVEGMMMETLRGGPVVKEEEEKDRVCGDEVVTPTRKLVQRGRPKKADIKQEFLHGLKAAGLDLSAA